MVDRKKIRESQVLPVYGDIALPTDIKQKIGEVLQEQYNFQLPENITTAGQLIMLLKKENISLRDGKIKTLVESGIGDNKEDIHQLTKDGEVDMTDSLKTDFNISEEENTQLLDKHNKKLQEWMEKEKTDHKKGHIAPHLLRKYQKDEYNISHIDALVLEEKIDKSSYIKILKAINKINEKNKLNLEKIYTIVNALGDKADVMIEMLDRVDNIDTMIKVLNNVKTGTMIEILNQVDTDTLVKVLNQVDTDTVIEVLNRVHTDTVIKVLNKDPDKFVDMANKYAKKGEINMFINILQNKKRLPRI